MLKSLELAGFKSFADKTRFEFPEGVTVVVGPNGSGKSNVVDALRWVLGTQSPRSLRGKEMTDVIFNGSSSRGPLNMAEATLAFDNREGVEGGRRLFDLDEPEVRLTRRVYRSGEGEYLVNGRSCRLRDFRELLAGTGIGLDSYSVIEQGKVDVALNASPLERRLLFEEAAGIGRFRLKKREAAKRLERVEQNLLRLSDIVEEVESRLRRVRSQAGKAKKYRDQTERLREVRLSLARADWRALSDEWRGLDEQHRLLTSRLEEARMQSRRHEEAVAASTAENEAADRARSAEERVAKIGAAECRDASQAEFERRRVAELSRTIDESRHAWLLALTDARSVDTNDQERDALKEAESTAQQYEASLAEAQQRSSDAERLAKELASRHEAARATHTRHAKEAADAGREEHRLRERAEATEHSLRDLRNEIDQATTQTTETEQRHTAAVQEQQQLEERVQKLLGEQESLTKRLAELRRQMATARQRQTELHGERVETRHRLEALAAEEQRLERLNQDISALVEASASEGAAPRVFGLVADLIQVDVDLAALIEAALEGKTHHVVVDSGDTILGASAQGHGAFSSRAAFQRLDCQTPAAAVDRIDLSSEPGVMGRADDFVESDPEFEGLLQRLLGRTWFVDTAETALRLSKSVGRGLTFVTFAGEVVGADGTLIVGPREDRDGVLTRRRRSAQLRERLAACELSSSEIERELESLHQAVGDCEGESQRRAEEIEQRRIATASAAQRVAALGERRRQLVSVLDRDRDKSGQLSHRLVEMRDALSVAAENHRSAETAAASAAKQRESLAQNLERAESARVSESARVNELQAARQRHTQLLESLRRSATQDAAQRTEPIAEARRALVRAEIELRDAELRELAAGARLAESAIEREYHESTRREALRTERRLRRERSASSAELATLRSEVEQLLTRVAQVELRRQQVDLERRGTAERLRDDYGIELERLIADPEEGDEETHDRESLRREADTLRRQVGEVGSVNLESLEELDDLESRFKQLSEQYADLSQAKTMLVRLTNRINSDSRELYLASFEAVRGHFRELFQRLFGGGEADLVMVGEEGEDPLEMGVDIVASPPGKDLQGLTLLSGGEKTMTCVALLLALFRSKPSPFCVLDEVDAALDDANIGRFSNVVTEFQASTQFVVVTHSKRTMTVANTLYGVTMQESGVSKQVSVRFEDVSEDGHILSTRGATPTASGDSENRRAA